MQADADLRAAVPALLPLERFGMELTLHRITLLKKPPLRLVSSIAGGLSVAVALSWPYLIAHRFPGLLKFVHRFLPHASADLISDTFVWIAYVGIAAILSACIQRSRLDARTRWMFFTFFSLIATCELSRLICGGLFVSVPNWLLADLRLLAVITSTVIAMAITWVSTAHRVGRTPTAEYYANSTLLDAVTQMPPLRVIHSHITRDLRSHPDRHFAVIVMEMDQYKRVNQTLGHHAGNQLMAQAAQRIRQAMNRGDVIARIGADQFAVYMQRPLIESRTEEMAWRLQHSVSGVMRVEGGHELAVSARIGITLYPSGGHDAASLIRNAETAMYHARTKGGGIEFFNNEMAAISEKKIGMERALRHALQRNEFALVYQPQISLATGAVSGLEALLRWQSREYGPVSPLDFIPLAEETQMMDAITDWVLTEACRFAVTFNTGREEPVPIAVNFSPSQLQREDLVTTVERTLQTTGLASHLLEIEITENAMMDETQRTMDTLDNIRALGVHLAIDDFGTGFSSMSYILRYNIDRLKIDRTFIMDSSVSTHSAVVTVSIIALAHGLGIKVIAEGVETAEQVNMLAEAGCDDVQGYYFSRPVAPEMLPTVLAAHDFGSRNKVKQLVMRNA